MRKIVGVLVAASVAGLVSWVGVANAQVTFPQSPDELRAWAESDAFVTDLHLRQFAWSAMFRALEIEGPLADKPYTTAIQSWFSARLANDPRENQMYTTVEAASAGTAPLDVYLLMGGDNMVGITESGPWHGPDATIRASLNHASGRAVMTLNCAIQWSLMSWSAPSVTSFTYFDGHLHHNPARECIEYVSLLRDQMGRPARVRGVFFYDGEMTVNLAVGYHSSSPVDLWADQYKQTITFLRQEYGNIPAVDATLATPKRTDAEFSLYWTALQQAQHDVVTALENAGVVDTTALPLTTYDGIHLSDASQPVLGQALATAMNALRAQGPVP